MDCSVCCETVKCFKCPYCDFESCVDCISTFLLGLTKDAHCMSCNKLWNRGVLLSLLPKSFVNGKYKHHRETILYEREKSFFPVMQAILLREKTYNALEELRKEARVAKDTPILRQIQDALWKLENRAPKEKKTFVRKCPFEGCKGFVSSKWVCSLCTNTICKDCNEVVSKGHVCDPEAVETMKLLKKDTKPCPTCGEMIFKSSGCSQMWCTSCHTVFDWNTMQIETGIIHNPHYYEFQRQNGTLERHPLDRPVCGDQVPDYRYFFHGLGDQDGCIGRVHRLYNHLVAYIARVRVAEDSNYENRKRFMKNEITECQFKTRIQRAEKAREKIRDVNDILSMFRDVLRDTLMNLFNNGITREEFKDGVQNLAVYVNESLAKVKVLYDNCVMQYVDVVTMTMKYDSRVQSH